MVHEVFLDIWLIFAVISTWLTNVNRFFSSHSPFFSCISITARRVSFMSMWFGHFVSLFFAGQSSRECKQKTLDKQKFKNGFQPGVKFPYLSTLWAFYEFHGKWKHQKANFFSHCLPWLTSLVSLRTNRKEENSCTNFNLTLISGNTARQRKNTTTQTPIVHSQIDSNTKNHVCVEGKWLIDP